MPNKGLLIPVNGKKIRKLREARGWSAYKLATKTGLSASAIWDLERGRNMRTWHLLEIAQALGVDPVEIQTYGVKNRNPKTLKVSGHKILITVELIE